MKPSRWYVFLIFLLCLSSGNPPPPFPLPFKCSRNRLIHYLVYIFIVILLIDIVLRHVLSIVSNSWHIPCREQMDFFSLRIPYKRETVKCSPKMRFEKQCAMWHEGRWISDPLHVVKNSLPRKKLFIRR